MRELTPTQRRSLASQRAAATRNKMREARGEVPVCWRCKAAPRRRRGFECLDCHRVMERERRARMRNVPRDTPRSHNID